MSRTNGIVKEVSEYQENVNNWKATLLHENVTVYDPDTNISTVIEGQTDLLSINSKLKVYLEKTKYNKKSDWSKVILDLKNAANHCGYSINLNGENFIMSANTFAKSFVCMHYPLYRGKKLPKDDARLEQESRKVSLLGDKKNQRKNGKSLSRMTSSRQSRASSTRCCFGFQVYYDNHGFVFKPKKNGNFHSGHSKRSLNEIVMRRCALTEETKKRIIDDAGITVSISITERMLNTTSPNKVAYVSQNMIRQFRSSHILKCNKTGEIVSSANKSEIELVFDLLEANKARIAYLAVRPTLKPIDKISKIGSHFALVSSTPHDGINYGNGFYIAKTQGRRLGIEVVKDGDSFFAIKNVSSESPLHGIVEQKDRIISINDQLLEKTMSLQTFVQIVTSFSDVPKIIKLQRATEECVTNSTKRKKPFEDNKSTNIMEEKSLCSDLYSVHGKGRVFTDQMYVELDRMAKKYQNGNQSKNEECEVLLSLSWLTPNAYVLGRLYGGTVFVDSTYSVCKFTNFIQFSVVIKLASGKAVTLLRIGLPHEKEFMMTYVFEVVIPSLLGSLFTKRVNLILSDGCPWLCSCIDKAIANTYIFARRGRCGFHIVTINMEKNVDPSLIYHDHCSDETRKGFRSLLQSWIYSWMKPTVFSESEFETSRDLLFDWLVSEEVSTNICSLENGMFLVNWIRTTILPHAEYFCFYLRKAVPHGEDYTCCCIEGTHNGLKNCAIPIKRTDTLPVYVKKCIDYDETRLRKHQVEAAASMDKTNLYAENWLNDVVDKGARLQYNIIQHSENYVSQFGNTDNTGLPEFFVMFIDKKGLNEHEYMSNDSNQIRDKICKLDSKTSTKRKVESNDYCLSASYPKFRHTWKVKVIKIGVEYFMVCACCFFKRCGLICSHIHHVCHHHMKPHDLLQGFMYHDLKAEFWQIAEYLATKDQDTLTDREQELLSKILDLAADDTRPGVPIRFKNGDHSKILKCKWNKELCIGSKVNAENIVITPTENFLLDAKSRLKGWNYRHVKSNAASSDLVPTYTIEDFGQDKQNATDEDINVSVKEESVDAEHQGRCRKEMTTTLYSICDMVEFKNNPEFHQRLNRTLEDFLGEAIDIGMSGQEDVSNKSNKIFAGIERKGNSPTRRMHPFSTTPRRKKKKTVNMTSP